MSWLKDIAKKRLAKPFLTDDIYTFIIRNQRISLSIVLFFYIASRIMSIITVVLNYGSISNSEFYAKIIFHLSFLILLFIGLKLIYKDKESISIGIIIVSIVSTFIFFLYNQPENEVIFMMSLFIRLIFIQMVIQFVLHNNKVNFALFLIAIVLVFHYSIKVMPFNMETTDGFDQFFMTIVIYGMVLFLLFVLTVNNEYHRIIRFIKQLTYVDYDLGLFNEKQLAIDFDELIKASDSVIFVAVYITNLLSVNRQIGHKDVQFEFLMRVKEMKAMLKGTSNLYKWEGPVLIFRLSDNEEDLNRYVENIEMILVDTKDLIKVE